MEGTFRATIEGKTIEAKPGSVIYIPAHVPYGPAKAPKGAALLRYAEGAGG